MGRFSCWREVQSTAPNVIRVWQSVTLGGQDFGTLYVTSGDKVFRRTVKSRGVHGFQQPIKPPADKLG
jgi:hypothetical protein